MLNIVKRPTATTLLEIHLDQMKATKNAKTLLVGLIAIISNTPPQADPTYP